MPLHAAAGCLFLPPSDAPSPRRPTPRLVGSSDCAGDHQLGQQCCPMRTWQIPDETQALDPSLSFPASGRGKKRHHAAGSRHRHLRTFRNASGSWHALSRNGERWRELRHRDIAPQSALVCQPMNFASDNTAGIAPAILDAIAEANSGYARGYGNDDWTRPPNGGWPRFSSARWRCSWCRPARRRTRWRLAHVSPPWGVVFCHADSHIATDECGAPEFFGGGLKLVGLPGDGGKIAPADAADRARRLWRPQPASNDRRGAVDHPGERSRHHLSTRRDRGAGRDRACALARRAHGRRAFRQCAGAAQRHAGADDVARPASTCCRSAPPKAARWRRRRW